MIRNFSSILGAAGFALAVAVCLLATVGGSKAGYPASEQPGARSGDAFRFCSAPMPGVPAIGDCVRKIAQG